LVISHRHRFIFIKTAKTAGTSIEVFLSPRCGDEDVFTPFAFPEEGHRPRNTHGIFNPIPEWRTIVRQRGWSRSLPAASLVLRELLRARRLYYMHLPGWQIRSRVSASVWDSYLRFCVERNPWDKVVSGWHYMRGRYAPDLTFDHYLAFCIRYKEGKKRAAGVCPLNYDSYVDPLTGEPLVHRILRYERLDEELAEVLQQVGIPFEPPLTVRAKGHFRGKRKPYQEHYSEEQRRLVAELFAEEIELLGYSFE
jgi:hypothetical protein